MPSRPDVDTLTRLLDTVRSGAVRQGEKPAEPRGAGNDALLRRLTRAQRSSLRLTLQRRYDAAHAGAASSPGH